MSARILVTNDDGIDAPGLDMLRRVGHDLLGPVTVVAPSRAFSGCSHLTTTDSPLCMSAVGADRYRVDGSPADCTRLGLLTLDVDFDWVLSGINDGGNLGVDVFMSGTVAAVREAALLGKPAVAFSQYRHRRAISDWNVSGQLASKALRAIAQRPLPRGGFWNVNLPDTPQPDAARIHFCPLDPHPLPVQFIRDGMNYHYSGVYQQRERSEGSDVDICFAGHIAISIITLGENFAPHKLEEHR